MPLPPGLTVGERRYLERFDVTKYTWQGWTIPRNSKIRHYVLNRDSLCRRWHLEYLFRQSITSRLIVANPVAPNVGLGVPTFGPTYTYQFIGGVDLQPGKGICIDCIRRIQQLYNIGGLPPKTPEVDLPFPLPELPRGSWSFPQIQRTLGPQRPSYNRQSQDQIVQAAEIAGRINTAINDGRIGEAARILVEQSGQGFDFKQTLRLFLQDGIPIPLIELLGP